MEQEYVSLKLPKEMGDEIDEVLKEGSYASRAEFVKDAIRRLLEKINDPKGVKTDG